MAKSIAIIVLVLAAATALSPPVAQAQSAAYSPLVLVYAGLLIVDGGAALANGLAVAMDRPDRRNGQFGLVLGTASMILAGALYAADHDPDTGAPAALMLGGAGLMSALSGALAVRAARDKDIALHVVPQRRGVTVGLMMRF